MGHLGISLGQERVNTWSVGSGARLQPAPHWARGITTSIKVSQGRQKKGRRSLTCTNISLFVHTQACMHIQKHTETLAEKGLEQRNKN